MTEPELIKHFGIAPLRHFPHTIAHVSVSPTDDGLRYLDQAHPGLAESKPYWAVHNGALCVLVETDRKVVSEALKMSTPDGEDE
jgi:hypothetical protein